MTPGQAVNREWGRCSDNRQAWDSLTRREQDQCDTVAAAVVEAGPRPGDGRTPGQVLRDAIDAERKDHGAPYDSTSWADMSEGEREQAERLAQAALAAGSK